MEPGLCPGSFVLKFPLLGKLREDFPKGNLLPGPFRFPKENLAAVPEKDYNKEQIRIREERSLKTGFQTSGFATFDAVRDGDNFSLRNRPQFPQKGGFRVSKSNDYKNEFFGKK